MSIPQPSRGFGEKLIPDFERNCGGIAISSKTDHPTRPEKVQLFLLALAGSIIPIGLERILFHPHVAGTLPVHAVSADRVIFAGFARVPGIHVRT
jgi:hypothetical protein